MQDSKGNSNGMNEKNWKEKEEMGIWIFKLSYR